MKTKQKIVTQALIGALTIWGVLLVAACGSDAEPEDTGPKTSGSVVKTEYGDGEIAVVLVEVDGKPVPCVVYAGYKKGGITCAFEGVRQ